MLKSRVIYEGARTGLYTTANTRGYKGRQREMTTGAHWSPARSATCARWYKRDRVGRERVLMGVGGWDRARTGVW
jgi:hypothetical protein